MIHNDPQSSSDGTRTFQPFRTENVLDEIIHKENENLKFHHDTLTPTHPGAF